MRKIIKDKMFTRGDTRIITYFAIFPVKIKSEVRWLETVKIKQVYSSYLDYFKLGQDSYSFRWENAYFI